MRKKPPSAIILFKCPRCRKGCEVVRYGGITFENCRSCGGLFLDKDELGETLRQPHAPESGEQTRCFKCGTAMKKNTSKKSGAILDFCFDTGCSGIAFEHEKYAETLKQKPRYYSVGLFCGTCGRESKFRPADHKSERPPACAVCGHFQSLILHPQRSAKKSLTERLIALALFSLLLALIFLNRSAFQARFYTFAAEQNRYHADTVSEEKKVMENRREFGEKNAKACEYYKKAYALRPASIDKIRAEYAAEACGYADRTADQKFFSGLYPD